MKSSFPRAERAPLLLLLTLCLLFWSRVLFFGRVLLPGAMLQGFAPFGTDPQAPWTILQWDSLAQYFPWRHFAAQGLHQGQIPLWNPFQFCGAPFMANAQSALFYPLNLPFWIFDTAYAFGLAAFLHSVLASFSTYFLARRWHLSRAAALLAAVSYTFCGYLSAWALLPTVFATASWLPLCLLLFERASDDDRPGAAGVWLPLCLGCALLAGHPQIFFYIVLALALRQPFLRRKWRGLAILGGALSLCALLAAIQVLPTLELARLGHRAAEAPTAAGWLAARVRALQPSEWPSLLLPDWPLAWGSLNENFGYVGLISTFLAATGVVLGWRPKKPSESPAENAATQTRPAQNAATDPAATDLAATDPAAMQAPLPAAQPTQSPAVSGAIAPRYFAFALTIFGLLYALATPLAQLFYLAVPGVSQMGTPGRALLLWSLGIALTAAFGLDFARARLRSALFPAVVLLLVFGELSYNAFSTQPTAPRAEIYPPTALTTFLAKNSGPGARVLFITPKQAWLPREGFRAGTRNHPPGVLPPNGAMVYGIHDVNGYDSLSPKAYRSWVAGEEEDGPSPQLNGNMVLLNTQSPEMLDSLAVRYVVTLQSAPPATSPGQKIRTANGCDVWQREMQGQLRINGANFYPGWKDGLYQPETFRFGGFLSLCALGFVAAALMFKARR